MTPLIPCARCAQSLPTTAAFCRRCGMPAAGRGAAVEASPHPHARRGPTGGGVVALIVVGAGTAALVAGGLGRPAAVIVTGKADSSGLTTANGGGDPDGPRASPPAARRVYPLDVPHHYGPTEQLPPGYTARADRRR